MNISEENVKQDAHGFLPSHPPEAKTLSNSEERLNEPDIKSKRTSTTSHTNVKQPQNY